MTRWDDTGVMEVMDRRDRLGFESDLWGIEGRGVSGGMEVVWRGTAGVLKVLD